jgi:hypothetical protein
MGDETNGILEELLALEKEEEGLPQRVSNRLLLVASIANRKALMGAAREREIQDKRIVKLETLVFKVILPVTVALLIAAATIII